VVVTFAKLKTVEFDLRMLHMKNKGRRHLAKSANCKGLLTHLTRSIESMSSNGQVQGTFDKKKWSKRVRGYFKSKTKDWVNDLLID